ncbi:MAG: hypothetical protein ACPGPF_05985 [Pontibacterium sp.]
MNFDYAAKSVLIVERSLDDLSALRELLQVIGFTNIQVASSVNMALQLMHFESYDFCFASFDLGRDEKTGLQLLSEAKDAKVWSWNAAFILIVDPERSSLLFGSLENAPDVYISKPYQLPLLRNRIEKVLRIKHVTKTINQLMDQESFDQAIAGCEQVAKRFPGLRLHLYRMRGIMLLRQEKYGEALVLFNALLQQRDFPWVKVGAGIALNKLGKFAEAFEHLNGVVEQGHVCAEAYYWAAVAKLSQGARNAALMLMRKAVMLQPSETYLRQFLGDMALMDGVPRLAIESYRSAIRYGKDTAHQSVDSYLGLARAIAFEVVTSKDEYLDTERVEVLEQAARFGEADAALRFAVNLCAVDTLFYMGKGDIADQRFDDLWFQYDALAETEQLLYLDAMRLLVSTAQFGKPLQQAEQRYQQMVEQYDWSSQVAVAHKYKQAHKHGLAFSAYKKAHALQPNHIPTLLNMVEVGLKALPSYPDKQAAIRFFCQKCLLSVRFGSLMFAQQDAYRNLYQRAFQ